MTISSFTVGPFAENTYVLTKGDEAILIDPGFSSAAEFNAFQQQLQDSGAELIAVVLTHAHVDHILGLHRVLEAQTVPVYVHHADLYLWNNAPSQAQRFGFKMQAFQFEPNDIPITSNWTLGSFTFDVRYTPGHAPDHIILYSSDAAAVIAGDTLFKEGVGRTDLYKGSMPTLKKSIQKALYSLSDETVVYPGHGPSTTIGHEKKSNPFVKADG